MIHQQILQRLRHFDRRQQQRRRRLAPRRRRVPVVPRRNQGPRPQQPHRLALRGQVVHLALAQDIDASELAEVADDVGVEVELLDVLDAAHAVVVGGDAVVLDLFVLHDLLVAEGAAGDEEVEALLVFFARDADFVVAAVGAGHGARSRNGRRERPR